jgi:hypothetical protein
MEVANMRMPSGVRGYRTIDHPLSQIEAAGEFAETIHAFVEDEWENFFTDDPPDEDELEGAISPMEMLGTLHGLGLRFEIEAPRSPDPLDKGYTHFIRKPGFNIADTLVYDWAFRVMEAVRLDHRAFLHGLYYTDLLFVPDDHGTMAKALEMYLHWAKSRARVEARYKDCEAAEDRLRRPSALAIGGRRGAGPNKKASVLIDRIALALRGAGKPLTPDQVANKLKYPNTASVAAALHQAAAYKKPKRIAGWIRRDAESGGYAWVP